MLTLEEAYDRILAHFTPLAAEQRPIEDALGLVLAEDIAAGFDIPPHANSAMDGFAVRAADILGASQASPIELPVVGYVAAGYVASTPLQAGQALRIMTGAPLPDGADTVVPFEETNEAEQRDRAGADGIVGQIAIRTSKDLGAHTRRAGEDVRAGDVVLRAGAVLRPSHIGVLASVGRATALVHRRPIVACLATGDELVTPGQPLGPGQIYDANQYSSAAQVQRYGGIPLRLGIARDTVEALEERIFHGVREGDMLITSAGVSRGDYDVVKQVLQKHGAIGLWTVAIRPGKPLAFGTITAPGPDGQLRTIPHLGLPGNPVSAMVTFELYARPAILKMLGRPVADHPTIDVELQEDVHNDPDRRFFARAIVGWEDGRYVARLTGPQGSGILTSMSKANALVVVPEGVSLIPRGTTAKARMLDWDLS